jgi:hypothetical protein
MTFFPEGGGGSQTAFFCEGDEVQDSLLGNMRWLLLDLEWF